MKNRSKSAKGILAQPRITMVAALVAACIGTEAHALGFGRMKVQSALGQPLRAEVELIDANSSNLRAGTAPASAYAQKGLEFSSTAKGIRASVRKMPNGRAVLVLSSDAPINEPFVDVVLQASDGSGSVIRDFSLLLDPPATTRAPVNVVEPATPRASTTARKTERMALPPAEGDEGERAAAPTGRKRSTASRARTRSGAVRVRRGDTAGQIAARNRPARVSLDQMLVALLQHNPEAFVDGNVNRLRSGSVLQLPSSEQAQAVSAGEARQIIATQSRDFNQFRSKLAATAPAATVASATGTSAPSYTLVAPVTMHMFSSLPTFMEQIWSLSALGCLDSASILPTTTLVMPGISSSISATSKPRHIISSTNFSGVTLKSTYSFNHLSGSFIVIRTSL